MITCNNLVSACAIIITKFDIIKSRINKVEPLCGIIYGDAVGPDNLLTDNDLSV